MEENQLKATTDDTYNTQLSGSSSIHVQLPIELFLRFVYVSLRPNVRGRKVPLPNQTERERERERERE